MSVKDDVTAVMIRLDIGGERSLFILLARDGTLNRQGTGDVDRIEKQLYSGVADNPLFSEFLAGVREDSLHYPGSFVLPDRQGKPCKLDIRFMAAGRELRYEFLYGSESDGPPGEICTWVERAVELTDPWFKDQKTIAGRGSSPRSA